MKKKLLIMAIALVAFVAMFALSACYVSRPDTEENVMGTYKLVTYTHVLPASDPENPDADLEERTTDFIKTKGITAYLVVTSAEKGYYVYKDNDTALYAREVNVTLSFDEDEKEKVKEVKYTIGGDFHGDDHPGKGKETLGVNFSKSQKILSFYLPSWNGNLIKREYSQQVTYEKVSDKTDLSFVSEQLNVSVSAAPYELAKMNGVHSFDGYWDETCPYEYFVVDLKASEGKADVYYLDRADEQQKSLTNLAVTFTINEATESQSESLTLKIGDNFTFTTYYSVSYPPTAFYMVIPASGEEETDRTYWFTALGKTKTAASAIEEIVTSHQPIEEPQEE